LFQQYRILTYTPHNGSAYAFMSTRPSSLCPLGQKTGGHHVGYNFTRHLGCRPYCGKGTGFGLVADIAIGIVGALIGSWLLPRLGIHLGSGIVPAIIGATIGAIILLLILRLGYRRGRW